MLYFAYGSNLNLRHMKRHAPRAVPVSPARLDGYRLVFRRYADIAPDKTGVVWGAVYDLTPACERSLDEYEAFPTLFRKITVRVDVAGEMKDAMAYVMNAQGAAPETVSDARLRAPAIDYFTVVAQGYRDWKLDPAPLTKARIAVLHPVKTPPKAPPRGGAGL
ncbi:MAG: gamma-glutamylcyclotransferase [Proteobacteria bacterium]|nr:gamma-glutamylcyclotransferase [Pseudomonadota bacterium]